MEGWKREGECEKREGGDRNKEIGREGRGEKRREERERKGRVWMREVQGGEERDGGRGGEMGRRGRVETEVSRWGAGGG